MHYFRCNKATRLIFRNFFRPSFILAFVAKINTFITIYCFYAMKIIIIMNFDIIFLSTKDRIWNVLFRLSKTINAIHFIFQYKACSCNPIYIEWYSKCLYANFRKQDRQTCKLSLLNLVSYHAKSKKNFSISFNVAMRLKKSLKLCTIYKS